MNVEIIDSTSKKKLGTFKGAALTLIPRVTERLSFQVTREGKTADLRFTVDDVLWVYQEFELTSIQLMITRED